MIRQLVLICVCCTAALPQSDDIWKGAPVGSDPAEDLLDGTVEDDVEKEQVRWMIEHPLDLNSASIDQLESIPGVTPSEVFSVIRLREHLHGLRSVYQILSLEDGEELLEKLAPFVTLGGRPTSESGYVAVRSRLSGVSPSPFGGSTQYSRIEFEGSTVGGSVVLERDAGEALSDGLVSGFLRFRSQNGGTTVIGGDYTVHAGQGLTLWPGAGIGKGGSARKQGGGIRGYRSTNEASYLRGIAAQQEVGTRAGVLRLLGCWSSRSMSGHIDDSGMVTSLYDAGLFRSESERNLHNTFRETIVAGRCDFRSWNGWSLGLTGYRASYSTVIRQPGPPGFRFLPAGSADVSVEIGNALFFGEAALCGGSAIVAGMVLRPRRTTIVLVLRQYDPDFIAMHANGFGENRTTRNENGVYCGLRSRLLNGVSCSIFVDLFSFPWRTTSRPLPTSGREMFGEVTATISRTLSVTVRYRSKSSEQPTPLSDSFGRTALTMQEQVKEQGRISMDMRPVRWLAIRSRVSVSEVRDGIHPRMSGVLLYTDVAFHPAQTISLRMRLTFFSTDSFDAALYDYEGGVPGQYSMIPVSGRGDRWYALVGIRPYSSLALWAKYAATVHEGERDPRSEFAIQVDVAL